MYKGWPCEKYDEIFKSISFSETLKFENVTGSKSKADQREGESVAQSEAVQEGRILGALEAIATEYASSSGPVGAPGMDVGAGDKGDESHPTQRTAQRRPRCTPGARRTKSPRGKSPVGPQ
mgnify:CR=1 FL=1